MKHEQRVLALQETQQWFARAVLGLGLCPFARPAHEKGQVCWVVSAARTRRALAEELALEALRLSRSDPAQVETTLIVHPQVLKSFTTFVGFLPLADAVLASLQLTGVLQVASFHPQYRFAELPALDPGHRSNQSPHPMLQLLREDSVARAVAAAGDTARIYQRNIETLRALGDDGWQALRETRP